KAGTAFTTAAGNRYDDPVFVSSIESESAPTTNGNFRLTAVSPGLGQGDMTAVGGSFDLDGSPRNFGGAVDMGAYQFQAAASTPLVITTQPVPKVYCATGTNVFQITASGANLAYQWEVNRNEGSGFVSVANDANHSGATQTNLTILNA